MQLTAVVRHSTFNDNRAIGGDGSLSLFHNGHSLGGAIDSGSLVPAVDPTSVGASLSIQGGSFHNNQSLGGSHNEVKLPVESVPPADGPNNGYGGAILVFQGAFDINGVRVVNNQAIGGDGGADKNGGLGVGGGIFFFNFLGGVVGEAKNLQVQGNSAIGGNGAEDDPNGGDGIGGGIAIGSLGGPFGAPGDVSISRAIVSGNHALGGTGVGEGHGGDGIGAGIASVLGGASSVTRSIVTHNRAVGGNGGEDGGDGGDAFGGGIANADGATLELARDIVMKNWAIGGDGGGGGGDGVGTGGGICNDGELDIDLLTQLLTRWNHADVDKDLSGV